MIRQRKTCQKGATILSKRQKSKQKHFQYVYSKDNPKNELN